MEFCDREFGIIGRRRVNRRGATFPYSSSRFSRFSHFRRLRKGYLRSFHDPDYNGEFARYSEQLLAARNMSAAGKRLDISLTARASWRLRRHYFQERTQTSPMCGRNSAKVRTIHIYIYTHFFFSSDYSSLPTTASYDLFIYLNSERAMSLEKNFVRVKKIHKNMFKINP